MRPINFKHHRLRSVQRHSRWVFLFFVVALLTTGPASAGAYYRYVDDNGISHFVDDESAIPDRYRSQIKQYTDGTEQLTPKQRETYRANQAAKARSARKAIENQLGNKKKQEAPQKSAANPMLTQVSITNNQVIVPVIIGYRGREITARLILDTGANVVVLYKSLGDRLGILWPRGIRAQVAGGAEIKAGQSQLSYIKMGGITVANVTAAIVPEQSDSLSHDGLLGMNVLRNFDYRIDFDRNAIEWRPRLSTGAR